MFNRYPFSTRPRSEGPFRRGMFKYILLYFLKDRPSHGYEIIQALEERFHGLYVPSAGLVYPTLQMLEEMGYVTFAERDGKKVYTITDEGRRFLAEQGDVEARITDYLNEWQSNPNIEDIRRTMREFGRLAELLNNEVRKADVRKVRRVREVIFRVYEEIEDILADRNASARPSESNSNRVERVTK
ncbi:MAG: PadR family transcriptional regulator [Chloroflexi bacterium]|nr:PadR family transcriptional regulator [Chloroflexota bacterium]